MKLRITIGDFSFNLTVLVSC